MHRHEGPPPRTFVPLAVTAALLVLTGAGLLIDAYDERPPWGTDIAYEGGYILASRIRGYDTDGSRTRSLLAGECARMERDGMGGDRAVHDPAAWVEGCLDGAAGHPSRNQGLIR
ncbi:hypothetical protein ACIQRS_26360 [Streptomyces termitum]|uniref:Uncharacterized protein n=1 Tax=Streptomyces termitum TaxID=67368 RepID=A0A918WAW6_9ACTN|nr:hypothetical protein [Streptomyces termitum]GHB02053.1 hypothetical protein GCM10010305_51670 [Streptomyces termitum]